MTTENWRIANASVAGQSHLNQNSECQDRFLCRRALTNEGEILIAVVADGAGSTTDGGRGAEIACEFFASQVSEFLHSGAARIGSLNEDFGRRWIEFFQAKIAKLARAEKKETREFASTLVGAIVGKTEAVFYQVGDGAAVFSPNGQAKSFQFAVPPNDSEYVNMTDFLTDAAAAENLRCVCVKNAIEDLILFSDGIFAVAVDYQTNEPHEPFLMPMIAPLRNGNANNGLNEKLGKFLASPKLGEKTDDDKTIILASRHQAK
ncbi:MAG: PP2C family serine/threonine-protein phosphatase [Pyrinomonadaceae bacterium]